MMPAIVAGMSFPESRATEVALKNYGRSPNGGTDR